MTMGPPLIQFTGISKSFFGARALENIHLSVQRNTILGLVGENGAGKSTLMNILGGIVPPDSGEMTIDGQVYRPVNAADAAQAGIGFIHQELNLFTNLSIADNLFIDRFPRRFGFKFLLDKKKQIRRAEDVLKMVDLDFSPATLVEKLQPGERQLVEIARALGSGAHILIFDEPTTSLTDRETARLFDLFGRLKKSGKTVIYISHILEHVRQLADDVAVLRDGQLVQSGPIDRYPVNRMISAMVGRDLDHLFPPKKTAPTGRTLFSVRGLSKTGIVHNVNFELLQGQVLGLFGLMGSGRTELARILFGLDSFDGGYVHIDGRDYTHVSPPFSIDKKIAFVTENRREEGLMMDSSIADNMGLVVLPDYAKNRPVKVIRRTRLQNDMTAMAERLKIKARSLDRQDVKKLSGGNQQKVVIGKWLLAGPRIFILDEPTRGIDVGAKYEIYSTIFSLAEAGAGILCISSELDELIGICDRILVMNRGELICCFERHRFDKEEILRAAFRQQQADQEQDGP